MAKTCTIRISQLDKAVTKEALLQYFQLTDTAGADVDSLTVTEDDGKKTATITFPDRAGLKRALKLHKKQGKLHGAPLDVDDGFREFTALSEGRAVDIVALHGLDGHAFDAWTYRDPGHSCMWLRDILPKRCPDARILIYGYNANISHRPSSGRIRTFAETFLSHLLNERDKVQGRPLVLVAHSLGGIVIKEALISANTRGDGRFNDILDSIRGVVFLGTPHRGGNGVSQGLFFVNLLKSLNLDVRSDLIRSLDPKSTQLFDMTNDFYQIVDKKGIKIRTFFEQRTTRFGYWPFQYRILVVPETSATLGIAEEVKEAVDSDHKDICKFNGERAASAVCKAIQELCNTRAFQAADEDRSPRTEHDRRPTIHLIQDGDNFYGSIYGSSVGGRNNTTIIHNYK